MQEKRLSQIVHGFLAKWLLLPLLAALACGFFVWSYLNINNLEQDQQFYTRTVGNYVQDYLRNCNWYLQHFTRHFPEPGPTLANKNFPGSSSPFQAIYVLDMQGQTLQNLPGKAPKRNFSGIITNYSPGKSFHLTTPYFSRFSKEIVVGMIKSMPGDRLLLAELNLAELQDSVLHFTRHLQKGLVYLTDAYGNLLAHPNMSLVNQQVNKANLQAIEEAEKNKVRSNYYSLDADWKLMSSSKLLDSHWIVVVQQDLFTLFAPALLGAVLIMAALLAFSGLMAFMFNRKLQVQVVSPLAVFTSAIEELKHGENLRAIPEKTGSDADSGNFAELSMLQNRFLEMQSAIKKREEDLIKSEEEMRSIYEAANNVAFVKTDCQGKESRILVFSPGAEHMFGYKAEEVLGSPVSILHKKEDVERLPEVIESMRKNKKGFSGESMLIRKNGEEFPALFDTHPVFDGHGNLVAAIGVSIDITSRKQAEEGLQQSEQKYRELVENTNTIILRMDPEGKVNFFNEYAQEFFGYSEEEILGENVIGSIVPETESTGRDLAATIPEIARNPEQYNIHENESMRKNGERVWISWTNQVIRDEDGRVSETLCVGQDVTDRKQAEKEQEKLQAQLNQAQKMESVGRLAGGVAHDFNNMLSVILGNTEIALEDPDSTQPLHDNLLEIQKAAQRSTNVVRQLLAFARKQTIAPRILDLNETVEEMLKMLGRLIGEDIDLSWQPGHDICSL